MEGGGEGDLQIHREICCYSAFPVSPLGPGSDSLSHWEVPTVIGPESMSGEKGRQVVEWTPPHTFSLLSDWETEFPGLEVCDKNS